MHSSLALLSSLLVVGAGLARAASVSISSGCQSTLLSIAGSSEASCLNVVGLASILTTPENSSLVQPLNSWLAGACAQDSCSNQTLSDIVTNITSGCSSDLSSIGLSDNTADLVSIVQEAYPTVRSIACLKTTSNDTLCATSLLTEIEDATGQTLSVDNILTTLSSIVTGSSSDIPSYIACSDCVKEAYNVLSTNEPEVASNTSITNAFSSQCGSSFVDGSDPSGVVEGTGSAAPTGTGSNAAANDASSFYSRGALTGIAVSSLAVVSSVFLVLA